MKAVYKYRVESQGDFDLLLPKGAEILSFGIPPEKGFSIWVLVDPQEEEMERRYFRFTGTGHPLMYKEDSLQFIGTVIMNQEPLVFHLFEIINKEE